MRSRHSRRNTCAVTCQATPPARGNGASTWHTRVRTAGPFEGPRLRLGPGGRKGDQRMTKTIHFLHTAQSNVPLFQISPDARGLIARHEVRDDLLARASAAGRLTDDVRDEAETVLRQASEAADLVLLTCSTLGPAADALDDLPVPVLRVDRALAQAAVKRGGRVAVLYAAPSTQGPTKALFEAEARSSGASIALHLVPGAWDQFLAGDREGYLQSIAAAADAVAQAADLVAFAQASMAPAAALCRHCRPLTSPAEGLAAALAAVQ